MGTGALRGEPGKRSGHSELGKPGAFAAESCFLLGGGCSSSVLEEAEEIRCLSVSVKVPKAEKPLTCFLSSAEILSMFSKCRLAVGQRAP